jgi:putative transposase
VELVVRVQAIAGQKGQSDGSRRMAQPLQAEGDVIGRYKARQLLQEAGGAVRRPTYRRPLTTNSRHGYGIAPNLLARQLDVAQPDRVWGGDITYLWTTAGGLYRAVLLDRYSRKVVGWAMSAYIDATLVPAALQMAGGRRQPAAGFVHHTDRGSQYAW